MSQIAVPGELAYAHEERRGLAGWLTTTDHKRIGLLYIGTALAFFLVAATFAMIMRSQTARPEQHVVTPEQYNQLFSVHGTTMVFLFGMPILIGFANYLVPLMIGAEDMAFPRLNALSYWVFLFGGLLLYSSFFFGGALDTGWFSYAPLTEHAFSSHDGVTFWTLSIAVLGVSSLAGAVNFIVTMVKLRAPGMTWLRMPIFAQATYINSFLILFAIPSLTAAVGMLYLDRQYGTTWFNAISGGDPLIWQHLFWFFGHPEVYILILPAFGMMSEVVPIFSRKPLFGRNTMIIMLVAIGFLGFTVWAHHMFTVGLPNFFNAIMAGTSMLIAIPTGVKIFNWLATMWGGALRFRTSLLFACGFIALFVVGGITGVSQAVYPFDWQVEDTFYIVGHLHNVLFAGTVFAVFAGFYYWFPKMTGRLLSDRLGKWHFWVLVVGFLLTFMPMYALGLMGMPRRVYTYAPNLGWNTLNLISAIGAFIIGAAIIIFVVNIVRSLLHGEPAGDNPWGAWTLEWATSSPPPPGNFRQLPAIRSDLPLWDLTHPDETVPEDIPASTLGGDPPDPRAEAAAWHAVPGPFVEQHSALPIVGAFGILIVAVGLLSTLIVSVMGLALLAIVGALWMATAWHPPETAAVPRQRFSALGDGTLAFIGSEVVLFGSLIAADIHVRIHAGSLFPRSPLKLGLPIVNTVILLSSGIFMHYALVAYRKGRRGMFRFLLVITMLLGAIFLGGQAWEYTHVGFGLDSGLLGTTFFTLTGVHGLHVTAGLALLFFLLVRSFREARPKTVADTADTIRVGAAGMAESATYYWHYVDAVWV
ncbi:MAG TPA: cytochrome c oxidase subunit I, partial [Thermoleophilia bacterium]|nr:cytochrome c oxidase subunit I [Thermoleophilia bacterium]